jgi:DNA-binding transcriptional LysR family regulator
MRDVIALADAGSFEQAASALAISAASLHRSARELERAAQCQLFERTARSLAITTRGDEIARRFRLAVRELEYGIEEISALQGTVRASLYIGVLPLFPAAILASSLNELLKAYPQANIRITEGSYLSLLKDLLAGKTDLLLSVLRTPDWAADDVREEPLLLDPWVVAGRADHPLASAARVNLRDLARFEWVLPEAGTPRRRAFERMFKTIEPKPRVAAETNSLGVQRAVLGSSDRLTLMPRREIAFEERVGALKRLRYSPMISRRPDGLATRMDWHPTVVQQRFLAILRQQAHSPVSDGAAETATEPAPRFSAPVS